MATLVGFLDYLRGAVAAKVEGGARPARPDCGGAFWDEPAGAGQASGVERFIFLGEDVQDWDATFRATPQETVPGVLADYWNAVGRANEVIEAYTDLTRPAPKAAGRQSAPSMRWALVHMIEETGRHAGHADILREQIDGATGR